MRKVLKGHSTMLLFNNMSGLIKWPLRAFTMLIDNLINLKATSISINTLCLQKDSKDNFFMISDNITGIGYEE